MCSAAGLPRATCRPEDCEVRYCGTAAVVLPVQDAQAGEFLAFEVFQAGAATHYGEPVGVRHGLRDGAGACRECCEFEDTHRTVPEDRTGSLDPFGEGRSGIRSN